MIKFVSLIFPLIISVVLAQQQPFIQSTFFQITDIDEDYDIVHSFIHNSPKFTATVTPDYFVQKLAQSKKQTPNLQKNLSPIYIEMENQKEIIIKNMEQPQATKLINPNLVEVNPFAFQKDDFNKETKTIVNSGKSQLLKNQNLQKSQEIMQKKSTQFRIQGVGQQHLNAKQRKQLIPPLQSKPALSKQPESLSTQSNGSDKIIEQKQNLDESHRLILIVVVAIAVITVCILLAICSSPSQNINLWQKLGHKPHEAITIIVNEDDQQEINITQDQRMQDTSLNDEFS